MIKLASILVLFTAGPALCSPIVYTFEGTGSGTVGALSFFDVHITIEVFGNTLGVFREGFQEYVNPVLTDLFIPGIGLVNVTDTTQMFSNIETGIGIGDDRTDVALFYLSPADGYNLKTDFGPLFNADPGAGDQFRGVRTTDGTLNLSLWENVTFTATVVPEPSTLTLWLVGLPILAAMWGGPPGLRRVSSPAPRRGQSVIRRAASSH